MIAFFANYVEKNINLIYIVSSGAFACLQTALVLDRGLGYFVSRKYVPSFIIVSTSFIGFWIPSHSYPARVTLIVTSLLSLITQQVQTVHIYASYIISIHIWNNICTTFVFLGLIEFVIATCWDNNNINQTVRWYLHKNMKKKLNNMFIFFLNPFYIDSWLLCFFTEEKQILWRRKKTWFP